MDSKLTTYKVTYVNYPFDNKEENLGNWEASSRREACEKALINHGKVSKENPEHLDATIQLCCTTNYVSGYKDETKVARCTVCSSEFTETDIEDVFCCPKCGTKDIPCAIKDDVQIKINWHELHILVVFAENYVRSLKKEESEKSLLAVMTIAERLQRQFPDMRPLTLFTEIKQLKEKFMDNPNIKIESNFDDDKSIGL